MTCLNALFLGLVLLPISNALPQRQVKRQISQLRKSYDFVIAGGGTTGLTIADRLTEAFPKKNILVIEYGEIQYAPGVFDPPQIVWGGQIPNAAGSWTFNSLPNPDVDNKTALVLAGKAVGGSSAINGMFFDRPSRFDFDAWTRSGSPELDSSKDKWDWDGMFPFFKKSVTFTEPSSAVAQQFGFTWDQSAFGGTTPIYSSFPTFLWGDHIPVIRAGFKDLGIKVPKECGGGDKEGLCWIHQSQHPLTARRSHAGIGHYAAVNTSRPNYDLLVRHQVTRLTFPKGLKDGPPVVEIKSLVNDQLFNVTAKNEVILSAGVFNTPSILLRSGIGPKEYLAKANIPLVLHLPGVGSNLQDHSGPSVAWNYSIPLDPTISPLPADMLVSDFAADALSGFNVIPAQGPYTLAQSNTALYLSLANMTTPSAFKSLISGIRRQVSDGSSTTYLPAESRAHPELIAGYKSQLLALANLYENPLAPSTEVPWATGNAMRLFLLHPLSRGTVRLNTSGPLGQPVLDYRTGSNPIDFDISMAHTRFIRKIFTTPSMARLGTVETGPTEDVARDDGKLLQYIKDTMTFSFMHPCCTAAMMAERKGGVVGADLKVHGVKGLRAADMSILPVLPSSHLSALSYALGEKASDIIIKSWSKDCELKKDCHH